MLAQAEKVDTCDMTLQEHTQSLLHNIEDLHQDKLFSDLQIFCDDGIVQSYRVVLSCCSDLVQDCLLSLTDPDTDSLILPGVSVTDVTAFLGCLYAFKVSPSQGQVDSVIKVLLALGVNIAPYIDIKPEKKVVSSPVSTKHAAHVRTDGAKIRDINKGVIVIPSGLEVVRLESEHSVIQTKHEVLVDSSNNIERDPLEDHRVINSREENSNETNIIAEVRHVKPRTTTCTVNVNELDQIVSGPKFACDKCAREFDKEIEMDKHQKLECIKQHFCEICSKVFSSSQTYSNHMKLHSKELEYKCEVCGKCFVSRSVLGNHMKTHDESNKIPRFKCAHCDKKFNHPSNLKRHIRTAHFELSDKKLYECQDCGKTFKDPSARKHHMKVHLAVKPYPCTMCEKSFASNSQLESHIRIHTGEKPFVCNMCGRCFVTNGQLKSHKVNRHVGVKYSKSHLCQECGQSFVKEYDLKVHMRKHTGERPYHCQECGKTFRSERNLVNHKRIHTGDKPYKCETCDKSFASCAGLRQHFKCHATCRMQATDGAYCKQDRKTNRYGGRVQLDSIPELSMDEAAVIQNLENFTVENLKEGSEVAEETVVYFNTDAGLGIGIEGVNCIQEGGLGEVTIQAIGLEMDVGEGGQVLSLVQIDEGMNQL